MLDWKLGIAFLNLNFKYWRIFCDVNYLLAQVFIILSSGTEVQIFKIKSL